MTAQHDPDAFMNEHVQELPIPDDEPPRPHVNGYSEFASCSPPHLTPVDALIEEFNERYAVINESGKAVIYSKRTDSERCRIVYDRMSFEDFRNLHSNRRVQIGTDKDDRPIIQLAAKVWLGHRDRRQYLGVALIPSGNVSGDVLNLWRGFGVEPKQGDWSLLKKHIYTVICGGNRAYGDYVINWLARLIQRPYEQGEVAIVLRGKEGCGKGILGRTVKILLGQHGLQITNAKHLVGQFNGHLRYIVFLFADEAFFRRR